MNSIELKNNFIASSSEVKKIAEEFLPLSYNQINWKPDESQWSIGECFEHLIRTNEKYIPVFELYSLSKKEDKEYPYKATFIGKFVMKSVVPENTRKFKTPMSFNPSGSRIKDTIVKDFINQNSVITELVKNIDSSAINKKISSPFVKLVKYSIGDSFIIISSHNLRHLQQAKRLLQNRNFPR